MGSTYRVRRKTGSPLCKSLPLGKRVLGWISWMWCYGNLGAKAVALSLDASYGPREAAQSS
jgi:hypothetical protein